MGSLFSSSSTKKTSASGNNGSKKSSIDQSSVSSKDKAILDLKNARDRLKKYKKKLETESSKLTDQAKLLISQKKKDRALLVLKIRKYKDNQLQQLDNQLLSVTEMIETVEWEHVNMEVLNALKAGNQTLNQLHSEMTIEDVAQLLEETQEGIEMENQINQLFAERSYDFDQQELEEELALVMTGGKVVEPELKLPDVPSTVPVAVKEELIYNSSPKSDALNEEEVELEIAS